MIAYGEGIRKIEFEFGKVEFEDKLTYVLLECVCYSLICYYNIKVSISGMFVKKNIFKGGIKWSPLTFLTKNEEDNFILRFDKSVESSVDLHYRRTIRGNEPKNSKIFGQIMGEIKEFLGNHCESKQYISDIAEVIVELAGNAWEHTSTDCLIDIDVKKDCKRKNGLEHYTGINIVVLNFTDILLGNKLRDRIQNKKYPQDVNRYVDVAQAYENHREKFTMDYTEEDFFNIAVFQNKISSRNDKGLTGGRGLAQLLRSLEKQSELDRCYMISGNKKVLFKLPMLEFNEEDWVGFNKEKDFINCIPDRASLGNSSLFMPGTAFNISLGFRRESGKDE